MNKTVIEERIHAAIRPQLIALEDMFYEYAPEIIGKHHRLYDSKMGRTHYLKRRMSRNGTFVAYLSPEMPVTWMGYGHDHSS